MLYIIINSLSWQLCNLIENLIIGRRGRKFETFKVTNRYKLSKSDEKKVLSIIKEHQQKLIGAWNEYFNYKS
ncbi:DUF4160 domain-containing protein [Arcobacter sp. FWKO B]|nr:DUF4160 domain-containing protein [Arcobacter sp. FWKO B]